MPKRSPYKHPTITELEPVVADLLQRVEALRTWGAKWADSNPAPPGDATIQHAREWLAEMHRVVSSSGKAWLDPMITASEEGEITFEWWNADRKLTIYVSETEA